MKFIHAADIHLGSPFQGLKNTPSAVRELVINSTGDAFKKLVQLAIQNQVDFVCIVGDLFDQPDPDLETLNLAVEQMHQLDVAKIPVFLSYGNHDYLNPKIPNTIFPKNVQIFGEEVETKSLTTADGTVVGLTNFSYQKRAEVTARIESYPVKDGRFDYQIGMLHGSMDGLKSSEAHYAPFTLSQLLSKNYDYWALGHIHKRQMLNEHPVVAYAGNTQGRHINEAGVKGVSLVNVDSNGQTNIEFLSTQTAEWTSVDVQAQAKMDLVQLITAILQVIDQLDENGFKLVNVNVLSSDRLDASLLEQIDDGLVQSQLQYQLDSNQVWVHRLSPKLDDEVQIFSELDRDFWLQAEKKVFNVQTIQAKLGRLMELDFIAEEYDQNLDLSAIQTQVELMLKQRNALGEDQK
jgi:exonuclease SbcD